LDVRDVDRDTALTLLGSRVDRGEVTGDVHRRGVRVGEHLRDRRGERRLAVVDVTDRSDVDVRLGPLELGLGHCGSSSGLISVYYCRGFASGVSASAYSPLAFWTISS